MKKYKTTTGQLAPVLINRTTKVTKPSDKEEFSNDDWMNYAGGADPYSGPYGPPKKKGQKK